MPALTQEPEARPVCHIVTPVGMLGYGFDEAELYETLARYVKRDTPVAIILDSGSTDSGPQKLATGSMTAPRSSYERDLHVLLNASHEYDVPILLGSAGGAGTNAHVDEFAVIIDEQCRKLCVYVMLYISEYSLILLLVA